MKKQSFEYAVGVKGLWGRKRKPDFNMFVLATEESPLDILTLMEQADKELVRQGVKPGASLFIDELPIELEEMDGVTFKTFSLFSNKKIALGRAMPNGSFEWTPFEPILRPRKGA